ncbi:MAG TPA: tRNA lysidine(34) synthetase TilS [Bryobacteraceae bacterium]|nr:tRNA lysidine(34) synthetase TilS [Bryobacteraceae bacterium]
MLDRIAQFIARHGMIAPGQRVGVAVSGGADSVFLLHALRELGFSLSVIHIEHGIRGATSVEDAEFVRDLAAGFGLPFHLHRANVPAIEGNLEEAARNVRQAYYAELIESRAADRVATGHTRSDQAETVLFRILRGSGLTGLAGILPVTREGLVRPLLEIDRAEIEAWLRERGVGWREDLSNQDRAYARNRLRHDILPLLRETFNPQLDTALSHLGTLARDEEDYWESALGPTPGVIAVADLAEVPLALARRRIRRAAGKIAFDHVERIIEMARSDHGHDRLQVPGLDVCRSFDWIRIAGTPPEEAANYAFHLTVPGCVELPGSKVRITLQLLEKSAPVTPYVTLGNELDWQRFGGARNAPRLEVRNWRPGDQYRRVGRPQPEKIKFFFQEARIPLWERGNWPIITYNETIVWARRFGAAAEFAGGPDTRSVLHVAETPHLSNHGNESNPRNELQRPSW